MAQVKTAAAPKAAKSVVKTASRPQTLKSFTVKLQPVEVHRNRDGTLRITTIYNLAKPPRPRKIEAGNVAEAFDMVAKTAQRHARPCYAVISPAGDVSKAFAKSFAAAYDKLERFHNLPGA
mgnify:CR=1 FL=1